MTNTIDDMLSEALKDIDFESEILDRVPTMSNYEMNQEVDKMLTQIKDENTNVEVKERLEKESRVISLKILRRP